MLAKSALIPSSSLQLTDTSNITYSGDTLPVYIDVNTYYSNIRLGTDSSPNQYNTYKLGSELW